MSSINYSLLCLFIEWLEFREGVKRSIVHVNLYEAHILHHTYSSTWILISLQAEEEKDAANHMKVDEQETEVEAATRLRLWIYFKSGFDDQSLRSEVPWQFEKAKQV